MKDETRALDLFGVLPRLCRILCGKASPFRWAINSLCGYAAEVEPQIKVPTNRKAEGFPHRRRQSRGSARANDSIESARL